jgi:anti-anti-sigma regulatory factor
MTAPELHPVAHSGRSNCPGPLCRGGWGATKALGPIIGRVFAALTDTEGGVPWSRRGLLRRVADELGDLQRTRAQLRAVEADMVAVLDELRLSRQASVEGPFTVVSLTGEADASCRELETAFAALAAEWPPLLIVDLSGLRFIDSWALHVVLRAARDLRKAGPPWRWRDRRRR